MARALMNATIILGVGRLIKHVNITRACCCFVRIRARLPRTSTRLFVEADLATSPPLLRANSCLSFTHADIQNAPFYSPACPPAGPLAPGGRRWLAHITCASRQMRRRAGAAGEARRSAGRRRGGAGEAVGGSLPGAGPPLSFSGFHRRASDRRGPVEKGALPHSGRRAAGARPPRPHAGSRERRWVSPVNRRHPPPAVLPPKPGARYYAHCVDTGDSV